MLKEENESLKKLSLAAEERESSETQLAVAVSQASFNLNEKTKVDQELKEALTRVNAAKEEMKKLKDAADRAKATENEVLFLKNKLQHE